MRKIKPRRDPRPEEQVPDAERAYAAGILDGEGCISIKRYTTPGRPRPYHQLHVQICMSDHHVLEWLQERFAGSIMKRGRKTQPHHRDLWVWTVASNQALRFLRMVRPYLLVKSGQSDQAMRLQGVRANRSHLITDEQYALREEVRLAISTLNYSRVKAA